MQTIKDIKYYKILYTVNNKKTLYNSYNCIPTFAPLCIYFITECSWQDIKGQWTDRRNRQRAERGLSKVSEHSHIYPWSYPQTAVHVRPIYRSQISTPQSMCLRRRRLRVSREDDGNPPQTAWWPILGHDTNIKNLCIKIHRVRKRLYPFFYFFF